MIRGLFEPIIDFLVPPRRTERIVRALTVEILESLNTENGLPYHDPRVTALVWELKYYADKKAAALAGKVLAESLLALAGEELGRPLLVPVPMHKARRKERGHNQTELLCEAALLELRSQVAGGRRSGPLGQVLPTSGDLLAPFEYVPHALARVRQTQIQQGLERRKRLANVKNSMLALEPKVVEGRVCVVVDDVATTGATLREARRALRLAGARRVHCVALARS